MSTSVWELVALQVFENQLYLRNVLFMTSLVNSHNQELGFIQLFQQGSLPIEVQELA